MTSNMIDLIREDADENDSDALQLTESDNGSRIAAANDTDSLASDNDVHEVNDAEFSDDGEETMSFTSLIPLRRLFFLVATFYNACSMLTDTYEFRSDRHTWKKAEWSLLVRNKQSPNSVGAKFFGIFLGLHDPDQLPKNWKVMFKFRFTLLSLDEMDNLDKEYTHTFSHSDSDYTDVGFNQTFPVDCLSDARYLSNGHFRVRVTVEYLPTPFRPPPEYNSKEATGMVGLCNLGATCYLNALLQMLFHINAFRRAVYTLPFEDQDFKESTTLALQSVFHSLQCDRTEVTTSDLTRAFGWNTYESFQQQDVQEMLRVLLDKLEEKMKGTSVDGVIGQLFAGKVKSYIRCINVDRVSERVEDFYDIQLDVKGCADIYESFRQYTAKEVLQGENQYDAEGIGKQDAEKGVTFTKFPPVLTIHLKRFEFDMQRMGFAKIHDHYAFPLRLDLNEFVTPPDDESKDEANNVFQLHSVLVHAGDVYGGHYFAYIRPSVDEFWQCIPLDSNPLPAGGKWFKFDDEIVSRAHRKEAVEMCYGRSSDDALARLSFSSAYMLVYIRETEAPKIMSPAVLEDIPQALQERITIERRKQLQEIYLQNLEESYSSMKYFTEADMRKFRRFSEKDDLIDQKRHVHEIKGIRGAKMIGMLLHLSRELNVDIGSIRLWECYVRDSSVRIDECVKYRNMLKTFNRNMIYFVESVAALALLPQAAREEWEISWSSFLQREKKWRGKVLRVLYEHEGDGIDRSSSFGMGDGTFHLSGLPPQVKEALCQEMNSHLEFLVEALEKRASAGNYTDAQGILILKLFDHNHSFPDTEEPRKAPRLMYYTYLRINFNESMSRVFEAYDDYIASVFQIADQEIPESWRRYELVEIETPTRCRVHVREEVEHKTISQCGLFSGDMLCAQQSEENDSESDDSLNVDVAMGNVQAFLLQQAWQIKANVLPFSVRDASTLQRKGGLWKYKVEDASSELCTHCKTIISLEMSMRDVVQQIAEELGFLEPDRLQLFATTATYGSERPVPMCISKDLNLKLRNALPYIVDSNHVLALQYKILPFAVKGACHSNERYFELHLIGNTLRMMRTNIIASLLLPMFADAVDDFLSKNPETDPIEMPFFYNAFKLLPDMQGVPEEFIVEDYLYLSMNVFADTRVHNLATMIRSNLNMPELKPVEVRLDTPINTHDGYERGAKRRLLDISDESKSDVELLLQSNSSNVNFSSISNVETVSLLREDEKKLQHERYSLSSSELVSEEDEVKDQLLLFLCRAHCVQAVLRPLQTVSSIPASWMDVAINNGLAHQSLAVQLISHEDLMYMNGCHPCGVESIPIAVSGYELFGASCRHRSLHNGPFICYLRRDDTYDTLAERLGAFCDSEDWSKFKLSVIRDRIPYALPRTFSPVDDDNTSLDVQHDLWGEVVKCFPNAATWKEDARSYFHLTSAGPKNFVVIGIQQSVQSVDGIMSTRSKRGSGGIKIRG